MVDRVPSRGIARIANDQRKAQGRLREVERPSGTQYARLLEQVTEKLAQIDQEVADAIAAQSYTRSQIDSKLSDVASDYNGKLANKANSSHTHDQGDISGTWSKGVNTSAAITTTAGVTGGSVTGTSVFAKTVTTQITETRVAVWGRSSDGFIGTASSSERFKTNIEAADIDPAAVLQLTSVYYQYREQVELASLHAQGVVPYAWQPGAHAHTELGMIAERAAELGFWEIVIWERDPVTSELVLDEDGEPIPFGIHYHLISVLQQVAIQWLNRRLERIEEHLGISPVK